MPSVFVNLAVAGPTTLVAGVADKRIWITGVSLSAAGTVKATLQDSAGTPVPIDAYNLVAGNGPSWTNQDSDLCVPKGLDLNLLLSGAVNVAGHITYYVK